MKKVLFIVFPFLIFFTVFRLAYDKNADFLGFRQLLVNFDLSFSDNNFLITIKEAVTNIKDFDFSFDGIQTFFSMLGNFTKTIFVSLWDIIVSIFDTVGSLLGFITRLLFPVPVVS